MISHFDGDGEPRIITDEWISARLDAHHGPSMPRLSGVETVLCEMGARRDVAYCQARELVLRAGELYAAHGEDEVDLAPWDSVDARTVRKWVRVARRAAKP